jgi:hypothetical protein
MLMFEIILKFEVRKSIMKKELFTKDVILEGGRGSKSLYGRREDERKNVLRKWGRTSQYKCCKTAPKDRNIIY